MSVTFTAEPGPPVGFVITCGCDPVTRIAPRFGSYTDARNALTDPSASAGTAVRRVPLPGCTQPHVCPDYPLHVEALEADTRPEVNVSTTNAVLILDSLGYRCGPDGSDRSGAADPAQFLGRILVALAIHPADEGCPPTGPGARLVDCGRPPGYLQQRLFELHALAQWCAEHHRTLTWH